MFQFTEEQTKIFEYSKGERDENGKFINLFADPAAIDRQLEICLPNRDAMIDQYTGGLTIQQNKARDILAYQKNPDAYMAELVTKKHGYQPQLPNPAGPGDPIPNPESALEFAKRNNIQPPTAGFSPEEAALIRMGNIAHQNLCIGIRGAFGLLEFDAKTGKGCTDQMAIAVLNHWQDWLEKKSGNTPPPPTSSPPSPAT